MSANPQRGFTLWELLVALLVVGILLGFGVPNFLEFQRNNAISSAANDFIGGVMAARTRAVQLQVPVTLCASPDPTAAAPVCSPSGAGTNGGFIVWIDENGNTDANGVPILTDGTDGNVAVDAGETVLIAREAPGGTIDVFADSGYVSFGANGRRRDVGGAGPGISVRNILYCDERGNRGAAGSLSTARVVRIDPTGRGQVLRTVDELTPIIAALGAACP